jgi:multiple sugar transport system ATP-binding protein
VRPEDLSLTTQGNGLPVMVDVVEELGADAYIYGTAQGATQHDDGGDPKPFIARVDGRTPPSKGETVYLSPKQGHVHMFSSETGERLGA